jgi:hypothetical protein
VPQTLAVRISETGSSLRSLTQVQLASRHCTTRRAQITRILNLTRKPLEGPIITSMYHVLQVGDDSPSPRLELKVAFKELDFCLA